MTTFRTLLRQAEQISGSAAYDDTLTMSVAETYLDKNLEADLNYIRSQVKVITGQTNWYDPPDTNLVTLEQGISGSLSNIYTFTGMDNRDDTTPTYSSNNYVVNGDNLEAAIGKLDTAVASVSGGETKITERLLSLVSSGSAHTLPESESYTLGSGAYLDVFLNGILLTPNTGTEERDYLEDTTTTVKFTFGIPTNSFVTYIIRPV